MTLANRPISVQHLYELERLVRAQEARASTAWVWTAESPVVIGNTPVVVAVPLARTERQVLRVVFDSPGAANGTVTFSGPGWTREYEVVHAAAGVSVGEVGGIVPWQRIEATYAGTGTVRLRHIALSRAVEPSHPIGQFVPADALLFTGLDARLVAAYRQPRAASGWVGTQSVSAGLSPAPIWHPGAVSTAAWNLALSGTRTAGSDIKTEAGTASSRINDSGGTGYSAVLSVAADAPVVSISRAAGDAVAVVFTEAVAAVATPTAVLPHAYIPGAVISATDLAETYSAAAAELEVPGVALAPPGGATYSLTSAKSTIAYGVSPACVADSAVAPARQEVVVENLTGSSATVTVIVSDGTRSVVADVSVAAGATASGGASGTLAAGQVLLVEAQATKSGNYRVRAVHVYF